MEETLEAGNDNRIPCHVVAPRRRPLLSPQRMLDNVPAAFLQSLHIMKQQGRSIMSSNHGTHVSVLKEKGARGSCTPANWLQEKWTPAYSRLKGPWPKTRRKRGKLPQNTLT